MVNLSTADRRGGVGDDTNGCAKQTEDGYVSGMHGVYSDTDLQNSDGRFKKKYMTSPPFPCFSNISVTNKSNRSQ